MNDLQTPLLREEERRVQDASGYQIQLHEIAFNQIGLKWGAYTNPAERTMTFNPGKSSIVTHFQISEGQQFILFREPAVSYDLYIAPTSEKPRRFFECSLSEDFFDYLFTEDSACLRTLHKDGPGQAPSYELKASMLPGMQGIINDMKKTPLQGHLKGLYLEAKTIELFLLQVQLLDRQPQGIASILKPGDRDSLYAIRDYIRDHYDQPCSILQLARKAGINQTKLKKGFKELFGTTVFGYVLDIRLEAAKQLLLEEKLFVGEVSDRIGYKHPHHFAAAFRRKFGILPGDFKKRH